MVHVKLNGQSTRHMWKKKRVKIKYILCAQEGGISKYGATKNHLLGCKVRDIVKKRLPSPGADRKLKYAKRPNLYCNTFTKAKAYRISNVMCRFWIFSDPSSFFPAHNFLYSDYTFFSLSEFPCGK